ncbi:MAG: ABC transporter ATP-binding protein [Bdellovibrionaceae bacterium]|nr:ABC transporter ATP-binding protein [Pseudobdellovibrionaceae bacterium]
MKKSLEARKLTYSIENLKILDEISLEVDEGECVGILGLCGSGKSTLLKSLTCQISPDSGDLFINNIDAKKFPNIVKTFIGFAPEKESMDVEFNVLDNLVFFAKYFNLTKKEAIKRAKEWIHFFDIEDIQDDFPEELNINQLKKVGLCRALMTYPKFIFIDEPTKGLSVQTQVEIKKKLLKLKDLNRAIIIATEDISDIEDICNRVFFISNGKIVATGKPKELINENVGEEVVEFVIEKDDLDYYIHKLGDEYEIKIVDCTLRLFLKKGQTAQHVIKQFSSNKILIRRANLDDVYLKASNQTFLRATP